MIRYRVASTHLLIGLLAILGAPATLQGQAAVTSPLEEFGFQLGTDYQLPNYQQLHSYWQNLARESDRMVLDTIGTTAQGRPQVMAIITSPENHKNLGRYKEISRRMALARGVSREEARAMAEEGKAVVWIDGGLHATEVLGAQQLMELVYQMVSRNDPETLRFLDDVILLAVHANPDGHDLVADWYMRIDEPESRNDFGVPVLYQEHAGHDNNRDFYMSNLPETTNMNRVAYREWYPQIVYNHHQTGPAGTVMFAPPFRDPPNHYLDPLILTSLLQVGSAMHGRFVQEGKGGTTMRSGASYSTWWNGGLRTTPYFHNMIGLLTETHGSPTPIEIPFVPDRQLSHSDLPLPVEPTETWHFRQSVDYSITANRAVLDYASRYREHLLFNIWTMASRSIERGSGDYWTNLPFEVDSAEAALERSGVQRSRRGDLEGAPGAMSDLLRKPSDRDPRGFVLPSDQEDFPTATKFVNALLKNGVEVHRATRPFRVGGVSYPAGSYVVKTDQAFRPHVLDMFEPQNHPNDFEYPGGPPNAPYDNAGWTLAYQMGVEFDRILEGFDGPFERIEWLADPLPAKVGGPSAPAGYLVSHGMNDAVILVNRVLKAGGEVYWLAEAFRSGGDAHPPGTYWIPASVGVREILESAATELGVGAVGISEAPTGRALRLQRARVALWDEYGGSIESGWIRFILEEFEFDFEVVFPPELDEGRLARRFDALIFPDDAVPMSGSDPGVRLSAAPEGFLSTVPTRYRSRIGATSVSVTVPRIMEFLEAGGAVLAVGSSTSLGYHAGLPMRDHLMNEAGRPLGEDEYYVPGSVLEVAVDPDAPLARGLGSRANVLFSRSPVFDVDPGARGVRRVAWFDTEKPLRSGWAWGQKHLDGGAAVLDADVGSGKLFLFGPEITFRGQSHGTFPLLFNGILYGTAEEVMLP